MTLDSPKTYNGSCLCHTIQYTITGEPLTFYVCHCINCRKATGSAFMANAMFEQKQVIVTQGEDSIKQYEDKDTGSGQAVLRSFCVSCGSNVFLGRETGDIILVTAGTLNEDPGWVPCKEAYAEGRRPWIESIKTHPSKV